MLLNLVSEPLGVALEDILELSHPSFEAIACRDKRLPNLGNCIFKELSYLLIFLGYEIREVVILAVVVVVEVLDKFGHLFSS